MSFKRRFKYFWEEVELWFERLLPNILAIAIVFIIGLVMAIIGVGIATLILDMIGVI